MHLVDWKNGAAPRPGRRMRAYLLAAAVAGLGTPAMAQDVVIMPYVGSSLTFTDNVYVTAQDRRSDFIARVLAGANASVNTARTTANATVQFAYDQFLQTGGGNWDASFVGDGEYAAVPGFLTLLAEGRVTQGYSSLESAPATGRASGTDRLWEYVYRLGPRVTTDLGTFADVTVEGTFSQVLYTGGDPATTRPDDSTIYQLTGSIATGERFQAYELLTTADYVKATGGSSGFGLSGDYENFYALQSVFVRLTPRWRAIGRAGYQRITDAATPTLDGFIWRTGLEFTAGPRSVITVEGGEQYGHTTWSANARIQSTDNLYFIGRYEESIEPEQVFVLNSVTDQFDENNLLPEMVTPVTGGIDDNLYGATALTKQVESRLVYIVDGNTFDLSVTGTRRHFYALNADDRTLSMRFGYIRQIRPDLQGSLDVDYWHVYESPFYGPSEIYQVGANLNYSLTATTSIGGGYIYRRQEELNSGGAAIYENVAFISILMQI